MSPPDPRSLIAAGRARKPTDADRDRVKSALLARIAAGGAAGAGSLTAASALGGTAKTSGLALTLATKIIGSALLAAALGAGVWGVHAASGPDRPATAASVLASGAALPPPASGRSAALPVPAVDPDAPVVPVVPSAPVAPSAPASSPPAAPEAPAPSAVADGSGGATGAAPSQKCAVPASSPGEGAGGRARTNHEPGAPREGAPVASAVAVGGEGAAVAEKPTEVDALGAEVKQLREARQALQQGRAAQALELLGPSRGGMLAAERAALRVAALCRAGRAAEARREAAQVSPGALAALLGPSLREQCGLGAPSP